MLLTKERDLVMKMTGVEEYLMTKMAVVEEHLMMKMAVVDDQLMMKTELLEPLTQTQHFHPALVLHSSAEVAFSSSSLTGSWPHSLLSSHILQFHVAHTHMLDAFKAESVWPACRSVFRFTIGFPD